MKISVAMAYYNGGQYISDQLESILSQLAKEDEVIISIDGAGDGSMDLLEEWAEKDARIRLIQGPGKGVVHNFEHALNNCTGDLIFLSDQDDIWERDKVRIVKKAFVRTHCLAVLHNGIQIDSDGRPSGEPDLFTWRASRRGLIKNFVKNSYMGCCMAIRRELLPIILPFPEKIYMHDYWIGTAAEMCGKMVLIKKPLLRYRRHGENVTQMTHSSLGYMIKKRFNILCSLFILRKRRKKLWTGKNY